MAIINHLFDPTVNPNEPAYYDKDNGHRLTAFFYIKGSKDFPSGQSISDPFGYDLQDDNPQQVSERPIFNTSIRDIYISYPDVIEVTNGYSGYSDPNNLILPNENVSLSGKRPRLDRDEEYISTLLIKNGSSDPMYKTIYPNFTTDSIESKDQLESLITNETTKPGFIVEPSAKKYNIRSCIFWQKMFTLLEFIKRHEKEIYSLEFGTDPTLGPDGRLLPEMFLEHVNPTESGKVSWYNNTDRAMSTIRQISGAFRRFITIAIPQLFNPDVNSSPTTDITPLEPKLKIYNPVRTSFLASPAAEVSTYFTDPNYDYNNDQNFKDKYETDVWLDQLWTNAGNLVNENSDPGDSMFVKNGLDIRITDISDLTCVFSEHTGRITKLTLPISYRHMTDNEGDNSTGEQKNYESWKIDIYFDPDAFIGATDAEEFPVWTYNDVDFDNDHRGLGYQYDVENPFFNKYDNDYANILVPNTEPDGTPILDSIHGKFVATNEEIESQMVAAVLEKTKSGGYMAYVPYSVRRVSPYISEQGEVVWDPANSIDQKFYVFYKTVAPTEEGCQSAIRSYLEALHSQCKPETRDPETGKVTFIGHEQNADKTNFLAKMYPSLFNAVEITIVPAYKTHCANGLDASANYADPQSYFGNTTPKRIHESIIGTVKGFSNFQFSATGAPVVSDGTTKMQAAVEIFKIGAMGGSLNGNNSFIYDFPWYAINKFSSEDNCLTSIAGFADYKQKLFMNGQDPTSIADIFQIIMIVLTRQMFYSSYGNNNMHDPSKRRYSSILNIPISYNADADIDAAVKENATPKHYNVAEFTLTGVKFKVYAQVGKDFGSALQPSQNFATVSDGSI